jgi:hypothetical protein
MMNLSIGRAMVDYRSTFETSPPACIFGELVPGQIIGSLIRMMKCRHRCRNVVESERNLA